MRIAGDDTIVALATARGVAALAIVRMSGPDAVQTATSCFPSLDLESIPSHTASVAYFSAPGGGTIDQVVVTVFKAPHTVTGEDVVEISCHGGDYAAQSVMRALVAAGARPADPGEFTRRGFLNGKMDLSQAEAVADLIHATSNRAQKQSLLHLKGDYSRQIQALRAEMLDLCAFIELELDFSEEDVAFADPDRISSLLSRSTDLLTRLTSSYGYGALVRDGVRIVIGGRPNAGKSTLLNALVGHDRAIVSEVPGTTRDEIQEDVEFDGLRLIFRDTAGLRETDDRIEAEGVRRAHGSLENADIVLYVYDASVGLEDVELTFLEAREPSSLLLVANKVDLIPEPSSGLAVGGPRSLPAAHGLSALAAQSDHSIVLPLLQSIVEIVRGGSQFDEAAVLVTNERHQAHLVRALDAITRARQAFSGGASGDILSMEMRVAMDELGGITGETTSDDVLGHIFSRFCIGK